MSMMYNPMLCKGLSWKDYPADIASLFNSRLSYLNNKNYIYESKEDGIRAGLLVKNGKPTLYNRKGEEITSRFPEAQKIAELFTSNDVLLDGELIYPNGNLTGFPIVQKRAHTQNGIDKLSQEYPLTLIVFDVLWLNNHDLTGKCYFERRRILEKVVGSNKKHLKIVRQFNSMRKAWENCIEGIVAKNVNAPYYEGCRHFSWFKVKKLQELDAEITGVVEGKQHDYYFKSGKIEGKCSVPKTLVKVGDTITIRFTEVTKSNKLRNPTFIKVVT